MSSPGRSVGRNDCCPCGSGKKYKQCCLAREGALESTWLALRRAEGEIVPRVLDYILQRWGKAIVGTAWNEFLLYEDPWPEDEPLPVNDVLFDSTFVPWFVFHWLPPTSNGEDTRTPAALQFLARTGMKWPTPAAASPAPPAMPRSASTRLPRWRRERA